jgi:hypothetical protein
MRALEAHMGVKKLGGFTSLPMEAGAMGLNDRTDFMDMFQKQIGDMKLLLQKKTAASIHFFLWFFVHGWSMVVLGIVCMVIATMGYIFPGIPVSVICIADAMVKLICGIYLLYIAKPSKYIPNMLK